MSSEKSDSAPDIEVLTWLETHKKQLLVGGAAALAVLFVWTAIKHFDRQKEQEASAALLKANRAKAGQEPKSADFQKIASDYEGTVAAETAAFLTAGALATEGKYDEARTKFEEFINQYPNSELKATAAYGAAACLDAKGDTDKAAEAYKQFIATHAGSSSVNQAKIALALIYEEKKPEEAFKIYEELGKGLGERGGTAWATEAFTRRMQLVRKHPELQAAKKPAITPATLPLPGTNAAKPKPKQKIEIIPLTNAPSGTNTGKSNPGIKIEVPQPKAPASPASPK